MAGLAWARIGGKDVFKGPTCLDLCNILVPRRKSDGQPEVEFVEQHASVLATAALIHRWGCHGRCLDNPNPLTLTLTESHYPPVCGVETVCVSAGRVRQEFDDERRVTRKASLLARARISSATDSARREEHAWGRGRRSVFLDGIKSEGTCMGSDRIIFRRGMRRVVF